MFAKLWHAIGGDHAQLLPSSASMASHSLNQLTLYLLGVSFFFVVLIFACLTTFVIKYRHRPDNLVARAVKRNTALEITWTLVPLLIALVAFVWGARQYLDGTEMPSSSERIFVVGKQWMWKTEHENGVSEINELHVPVGRDVQLVMISQDVIHSFFVPDFRMKYDVLPGRYTKTWFRAEHAGRFHFVCSQYCGTDHSLMVGTVTAMSAKDYEAWAAEMKRATPGLATSEERGQQLYLAHGCVSCHEASPGQTSIGPSLTQLQGTSVLLNDQRRVTVDENYLRESLLEPHVKVVAGYPDVMPTYAGQLQESEIIDLIRYLYRAPTPPPDSAPTPPPTRAHSRIQANK